MRPPAAPREGNPFGSAAAARDCTVDNGRRGARTAHPHHEISLLRSISTDRKLHGEDEARSATHRITQVLPEFPWRELCVSKPHTKS